MNNLATNIESKMNSLKHFAPTTLEESRLLVATAHQFLGATVAQHITLFFNNNTEQGLTDLKDNLNLPIATFNNALKAYKVRLELLAKAEAKAQLAQAKEDEAKAEARKQKAIKDEARAKETALIKQNELIQAEAEALKAKEAQHAETKAKVEVVKAEVVKAKAVETVETVKVMTPKVITEGLSSTDSEEKIFIMSMVPQKHTVAMVKIIKTQLVSVRANHPELASWSSEAIFAASALLKKGHYIVPEYLTTLDSPQTKEEVHKAVGIEVDKVRAKKQADIDSGKVKKLSFAEVVAKEAEEHAPTKKAEPIQMDTQLNITFNAKGDLTATSTKGVTDSLHDLGLNDMVVKKYAKAIMAKELKALKKEVADLKKELKNA